MRKNVAFLDLLDATPATIFNTGSLGTTMMLFGAASGASPNMQIRRIEITNKSAAAYVTFLPTTVASPAFVASAANIVAATEGVPVFPGTTKTIHLSASIPLWLVASAASTPVQIVSFDKTLK